jgi:hypothetical protein
MKIMALEKEVPEVGEEDYLPHLKAEAGRVWELYQAGVVREVYFRQEDQTAVLILECAGREEAQGVLKSLPLVQAGLIDFDVFTLTPYPGFARLFEQDQV